MSERFTIQELKRLVGDLEPGLERDINWNAPLSDATVEVVALLERHGINETLRTALERERPNVEGIADIWCDTSPQLRPPLRVSRAQALGINGAYIAIAIIASLATYAFDQGRAAQAQQQHTSKLTKADTQLEQLRKTLDIANDKLKGLDDCELFRKEANVLIQAARNCRDALSTISSFPERGCRQHVAELYATCQPTLKGLDDVGQAGQDAH